MAVKNLEKKNEVDLLKELKQKQDDLRQFRFGLSGSKTRNTKSGKNIKKDIARIKTELNSRTK